MEYQNLAAVRPSTGYLSKWLSVVFGVSSILLLINLSHHLKQQASDKSASSKRTPLSLLRTSGASNNQYDATEGICYIGYDISHTNNKPGSHDACFAACLAHNSYLMSLPESKKGQLCAGWTSRKASMQTGGVSTKTCYLKSKLDEKNSFKSAHCSSAKLWRGANVAELSDFDYNSYDDGNEEPYEYVSSEQEYYDYYKDTTDKAFESTEGESGLMIRISINSTNAISELPKEDPDFEQLSVLKYNEPIATRDCSKSSPEKEEISRPMRTYIFCLQATGCTLLPYLMAQAPNSVAILDIGVRQSIPPRTYFEPAHENYPATKNIIIKQAIRGDQHDLAAAMEVTRKNYDQDLTILFIRNPIDSFLHLINHIGEGTADEPDDNIFSNCNLPDFSSFSYGLRCGTPVSKLRALNKAFINRNLLQIDEIIKYEEICAHEGRANVVVQLNKAGFCTNEKLFNSPKKTIVHVMKHTMNLLPSTRQEFSKKKIQKSLFWGAGNLQNTFHHSESWETLSEAQIFAQCNVADYQSARENLLKTAGKPYNSYRMEEVVALVRSNAPDLMKLYE